MKFKIGDTLVSTRRPGQIGQIIASNPTWEEPSFAPEAGGEWYLLQDINYPMQFYEHVEFLKLIRGPNDIMKDLV